MDVLVGLISGVQFRIDPQGVLQSAGLERHHPGNAIHIPIAHPQAAADIAQGGLGPQSAESDNLRHPVAAVAFDDIVQHLVPPVILKIHIDVRHFLAFHIQEPLENQPIFQGIDIGDAEAVEGDAGGGAAADSGHYAPPPHKIHNVPHHQEIVGELGIADYFQFVLQALLGFRSGMGIAAAETLPADLRQIGVGVHIVRGGILGQVGQAKAQFHIAHFGNALGVFQGRRIVGKELGHFRRAFDVVGIILHPQPLFILHRGVGLDADVDVLQGRFVAVDIMGVVGYDQGKAHFLAEIGQGGVNAGQLGDMFVALQLEEIVFPEQFPIPAEAPPGLVHAALGNQPGNFRRGASGKANQARAVLFEQFVVDAGAVVKALEVGAGHQLHQVAVAAIVPGQEDQMIGAALGAAAVVAAVVGHIDLAADNGLYAHFLALGIKVHHAVQIAVIGDGQGLHPQIPNLADQGRDAADAVQHTVFGMGVQVGEHGRIGLRAAAGDFLKGG